MQKWFDNVFDKNGTAQPNATVRVTLTSTGALASIFSDDGVTAKVNPITCDQNGYYEFYAANGKYTLTFGGAGITAASITNVQLQDDASTLAAVMLANLMGWSISGAFAFSGTRDPSSGVLLSATVTWPDGTPGVFTAVTQSTAFPGAVDVASITYGIKTATLTVVSRDGFGGPLNVTCVIS